MNSRERVLSILNLEEPDRVAIHDFVWSDTQKRWEKEGLPSGVDASKYFGFELSFVHCHDLTPGYEGITVKLNERSVIVGTPYGSVGRDGSWPGMPSYLRSGGLHAEIQPLVKNLDDFKEKVEPYLDANDPRRLCGSNSPFRKYLKIKIERLKKEHVTLVSLRGPYVYSVSLCGVPRMLHSLLKDPRFVRYMIDKISKFTSEILENLIELGVDGLWMRDDLAYRHGPFFSPEVFRKMIMPGYVEIGRRLRKEGLPFILHSDGNIKTLIPDLIRSGVTALNPLEVSAGMDIRELKEKYGDKLAFIGGIDKRILAGTSKEIKEEVISKLEAACPGGGYIIGSDHSVLPDIPFRNYEYMVRLAKKYGRYRP